MKYFLLLGLFANLLGLSQTQAQVLNREEYSPTRYLVCNNFTVYVLIYDRSMNTLANSYREPWRLIGASMPPVENVVEAARAQRKVDPVAVKQTVVYYDGSSTEAKKCAEVLASTVGEQGWLVLQRPPPKYPHLSQYPSTIEVWMQTRLY